MSRSRLHSTYEPSHLVSGKIRSGPDAHALPAASSAATAAAHSALDSAEAAAAGVFADAGARGAGEGGRGGTACRGTAPAVADWLPPGLQAQQERKGKSVGDVKAERTEGQI